MAQVWLKYGSSMPQAWLKFKMLWLRLPRQLPLQLSPHLCVCTLEAHSSPPMYLCMYISVARLNFFARVTFHGHHPNLFARVTSVITSIFDHFYKCRYNHVCFHRNGVNLGFPKPRFRVRRPGPRDAQIQIYGSEHRNLGIRTPSCHLYASHGCTHGYTLGYTHGYNLFCFGLFLFSFLLAILHS